jgi:hypothetical protein
MPPNSNHIEEQESAQLSETPHVDDFLQRSRMHRVRREIGTIADRSFREKLIDEEAYRNYAQLADRQEEFTMTEDLLQSIRRAAESHEYYALGIKQLIARAKTDGIASDKDEAFLMEQLVVENIDFVSQHEAVYKMVKEKIERMTKDREELEKIWAHPLVRNTAYIKLDATNKLKVPVIKEFLEMTVPERRAFLKKFNEALPKAEAYAEQTDKQESRQLNEKYRKELEKRRQKGVIGNHTFQQYIDGFKHIDKEEKEYWLKEIGNQMKRYEELWKDIRITLSGDALKQMEAQRDSTGYTELFKQLSRHKEALSKRLCDDYSIALEVYREQGIIGHHTYSEFMNWMRAQPVDSQKIAESLLPGQMERYQSLWDSISQLGRKQRQYLESRRNEWGYSELKQQYDAFLEGAPIPSERQQKSDDELLGGVRNQEVKKAIQATDKLLEDQGDARRQAFMGTMGGVISSESSSGFDASSFQSDVHEQAQSVDEYMQDSDIEESVNDNQADFQFARDLRAKRRAELKKAAPEPDHPEKEDAEDDRENKNEDDGAPDINKDMKKISQYEMAETAKVSGFMQSKVVEEDDKTHRKTNVTINDKNALKQYLSENASHSFRGKSEGNNDEVTFSAGTASGGVELNLSEVKIMQKYLDEKGKQHKKEKAEQENGLREAA